MTSCSVVGEATGLSPEFLGRQVFTSRRNPRWGMLSASLASGVYPSLQLTSELIDLLRRVARADVQVGSGSYPSQENSHQS